MAKVVAVVDLGTAGIVIGLTLFCVVALTIVIAALTYKPEPPKPRVTLNVTGYIVDNYALGRESTFCIVEDSNGTRYRVVNYYPCYVKVGQSMTVIRGEGTQVWAVGN